MAVRESGRQGVKWYTLPSEHEVQIDQIHLENSCPGLYERLRETCEEMVDKTIDYDKDHYLYTTPVVDDGCSSTFTYGMSTGYKYHFIRWVKDKYDTYTYIVTMQLNQLPSTFSSYHVED